MNGVTEKQVEKKPQPAKKPRMRRLLKRFFTQFGTALLAIAVVAYVFLQLMLNIGDLLEIETASYINTTETAELTAFLFRDETLLSSGASGTDCFLAAEGEKVRINQAVAITYSDLDDAERQRRINEIDSRLSVLNRSSLSTGESTTSISKLDNQIDKLMLEIIRDVDESSYDKAIREKEELLILMNRRQAIVQSVNYYAEISRLNLEREQLAASQSGASFTLSAPISGYFYSSVDGYENIFTLDALKSLTCTGFNALYDSLPDKSVVAGSSGKIVIGSTWYIAVGIDKRSAENYTSGKNYEITFQYSNNTKINMLLERKITQTDGDITVLVLSTGIMPDGFDYSRCQTVEVPKATYEGIRVSSACLRVKNGVTGVYIVKGSRVIFKEAVVLCDMGNYVICKIPDDPNYPGRHNVSYVSSQYLSLHDAVIVSGNDIYEGKMLS